MRRAAHATGNDVAIRKAIAHSGEISFGLFIDECEGTAGKSRHSSTLRLNLDRHCPCFRYS